MLTWLAAGPSHAQPSSQAPASSTAPLPCQPRLSRSLLDRSLALGTSFLLANQRPAGNFEYQYDWQSRRYDSNDSQVRQAGAAWGLALIHQDQPTPAVAAALLRALRFFRQHSRLTTDGRRYIVYPGSEVGSLGTVALVALAHIDYLRSVDDPTLRQQLDEYLAFVVSARRKQGRFHGAYDHDDGAHLGNPSPYFDGESLLALVKASKYLGRSDLRGLALREAEAGHRLNVVEARRRDPDSKTTKGYYQWSSMAYFELATSSWPGSERYGDWLIEQADWMIDTHRTLRRRRNTAYAYEGLIPAYAVARARGDRAHVAKLGCTIEEGLGKLTSWQVGSPTANAFVAKASKQDAKARGGVQNHASEPGLRIDVAQHQMHAVLLARRHYLTP
ncbi:MAG: hypothetical protein JRI68_07885 [Deltaproteobacteria bacterium]|nr:hypothetical protein [Deltaproteobacteria bacterium]